MFGQLKQRLEEELTTIKASGLYKEERVIESPQGVEIRTQGRTVLNFCANNYLGLSNHPKLAAAAKQALDRYGYGMSSVRFICGTLDLHKQLERATANFVGTDDAILYSSCFDANGGLFETLVGEGDVIISASLNHASIIDGIRLSKADRKRYEYNDMADLEAQLKASSGYRTRLVCTDGVFSMDGAVADLQTIVNLAEKYDAVTMVDDSHAVGFVGPNGRGSAEHCGVMGKIDIITGTYGKALGGASGGFTAGRQEIVDFLRQRSRPYLFSNTLAPSITAGSIEALRLVTEETALRRQLSENTAYFREGITKLGFEVLAGEHPITPVMLYDAKIAKAIATDLLAEGIYVIAFSYPVVPKEKARIRVQISAAHTREHLDTALAAFEKVGKKYRAIA